MLLRVWWWWTNVRLWLWRRYGVPMPPIPAWEERVREYHAVVSGGAVWFDQENRVSGAPVQWSLVRLVRSGKVESIEAACAVSQATISGCINADGTVDPEHYGVRCARCGLPLAVRYANMTTVLDIPMCRPCRPYVRRVLES